MNFNDLESQVKTCLSPMRRWTPFCRRHFQIHFLERILFYSIGSFSAVCSNKIQNFSFIKMHLKMSFAKWRPFCPGTDELKDGQREYQLNSGCCLHCRPEINFHKVLFWSVTIFDIHRSFGICFFIFLYIWFCCLPMIEAGIHHKVIMMHVFWFGMKEK